jgi:hypothetical protein
VLDQSVPTEFPYMDASQQFWCSYSHVYALTKDYEPFNSGSHMMIMVIGVSFTLENIVKYKYETTIGRTTEILSKDKKTQEDIYAAKVAREYTDFVYDIPWYEFPFKEKLDGLWSLEEVEGSSKLRQYERRFALGLEYGVKAGYGSLIKKGTKAAYGEIYRKNMVLTKNIPDEIFKSEPKLKLIKQVDSDTQIVEIPRYQDFTNIVKMLSQKNINFLEVAGNDEIFITAIANKDYNYSLPNGEMLYSMPITTEPQNKRLAIKAPVTSLTEIIRQLESQNVFVEHIYDY